MEPNDLSQNIMRKLFQLEEPPHALRVLGDMKSLVDYPLISVVGAREPRPWALEWMEYELGATLKALKVGIVSGGARGVDQMAHQLAIRHHCPTLVVIPSGLKQIYPTSIRSWVGQPGVCFVSEYEDEKAIRKHHFHKRNRLIAAASPLTLVVQANEASGSMITARLAYESGKTLAVVPASPMDPGFSGNNQLLYDGAQMVRNSHDLRSLIQNQFN